MRCAVYGTGGVGGYFGARLAEAGHPVVFVARGAHLAAIRRDGLRLESVAGNHLVLPAVASDEPRAVEAAECVLLGVKAWQVTEAARALEGVLAPGAFVVTLQNGVEAPSQAGAVLGASRVVPGRCDLMSYVAGPGHIRHAAVEPRIHFGERGGGRTARVEALREAFAGAVGVTAAVPDDIEAALWEKFLFIAPVSAVLAVSRSSIGAVREVAETRRLLESAMDEVAALARARGVRLPAEAARRVMGYVDGLPWATTTSMQRDTLEGRPSELDYQAGTVVRLARAASLAVPTTEFLYASLLPGERRARAGGDSERPPGVQEAAR